MDVAVNSPLSATETQHLSYDGAHLNNDPAGQRRHIRYASPDASTARRVNEPTLNNPVRSSPNGVNSYPTSNRTSPSISPFVISQVLQEPESRDAGILEEANGQNHDRMETDLNSEESLSEFQSHVEVEEPVGPLAGSMQLEDGEIMDTTPDSPNEADLHQLLNPGQLMETIIPISPLIHQDDLVLSTSNENAVNPLEIGPSIPADPTAEIEEVLSDTPAHIALEAVPQSTAIPPPLIPGPRSDRQTSGTGHGFPQTPAVTDPNWTVPQPTRGWGGEREDESQEDDSSEEDDYPFWATYKEDPSCPDEEELRAIEEHEEFSALDHEHWEAKTYEALEDPEYVPAKSGRIVWKIEGVNGTPEKPNREKIMRSPSVLIGDHYWNIKYYPRGNEGIELLSVYIECSTSPYEEKNCLDPNKIETSGPNSTEEQMPSAPIIDTSVPTNNETLAPADPPAIVPNAEPASILGEDQSASAATQVVEKPVAATRWEVAAQIGCIIYNPNEPRVHAFQKSNHRYQNENPDWGWTRFHGPWDEIHKRQRGQRQALLRNDTLIFTAYIRTIRDETGNLWWHPAKTKPEWNSLERVGLRRLVWRGFHSSALIAALSSWLYLNPITDRICTCIFELKRSSGKLNLPLLDALWTLVREALAPAASPTDTSESSLANIASILEWYGENIYHSKFDVVATWETLQRIVNIEASEIVEVPNTGDLFHEIVTLKQSDTRMEQPLDKNTAWDGSAGVEPRSVLETLELAFHKSHILSTQKQTLTAHQKAISEYPSVLQIELHRQKFFPDARRWKKLTHKVKIDEILTIDLPFTEQKMHYTLYGMIVHNGDLESQDYYSVLRPKGPGSSWLKYAGDKDRKGVSRLTSKQAIANHEGEGDKSEGVAAVAYIVLYVRTDSLSKILGYESMLEQSHKRWDKDGSCTPDGAFNPGSNSKEIGKKVSVQIYRSDRFREYNGRGILNPMASQSAPNMNLEFAASATLGDVEKYLSAQKNNSIEQSAFRLWALNFGRQCSERGSPQLISALHEDHRLDELATFHGGCNFWLHCLSSEEAEEIKQRKIASRHEPPAVAAPDQSTPAVEVISEQREQASQQTQSVAIPTNETEAISATNQANLAPNDEDTVMEEVQDAEETVVPDSTEASLSWISAGRERLSLHTGRVYFFLKEFDCEKQRLCGLGSYFAKQDEKLGDAVRRVSALAPGDQFDLFQERSQFIKEHDRLDLNITFNDSQNFPEGRILIVQRRSSESELAKLEAEGKCTNLVDFFIWLHRQSDPTYLQNHRLQSYFSSSYKSTELKCGRPHGHGVLITMSGDAYSGNFVAGAMSGRGTMDFANGDTYIGQWKANEPNGHGKMVYAKTGNVYVGGFRKRKRHGKGVMQFEVADEELQLCRICYEEEMDALFYECGHVAACEACARQVESCPVCRKSVRAVVKIWRT